VEGITRRDEISEARAAEACFERWARQQTSTKTQTYMHYQDEGLTVQKMPTKRTMVTFALKSEMVMINHNKRELTKRIPVTA